MEPFPPKVLPGLCALAIGALAASAQPEIELHGNGLLSWTNSTTNAQFTLEWAPRLEGSWQRWADYVQSPVTGASMSVDVPMFFRLALHTNVSRFVPPPGTVLMMIGQDTNNIDRYVAELGLTPGGVMLYTAVQNPVGLTSPFADGGGTQYGQYLADTYTNSVLQIGLYMVDALDGVLAGTYDGNIDTIGSWIQSTDRPVYLRIGYEFDADWTGYDPAKYQQVYRHIVDRYRSNGIDNVAYVWHSQAAPVRTNLMCWYPGDSYVDWVAASVFGSPSSWNRSNLVAVAELARQLEKPFMIAEASPHGIAATQGTTSWIAWYDPTFEFIRDYDVRAFCYINCDWDADEMWQFNLNGWGDARVQSDPDVRALWLNKMTNGVFLHAATNLFERLGR